MTMAASGRIRRSVRFAKLESQSRKTEVYPRRQRMTVADHLETSSFQNSQDWTGSLGISPSGRFQIVENSGKQKRILTRDGIRQDWGRNCLMILAAILTVSILLEMAVLGAGKLRIQKLNSNIAAIEERNEALRASLARSSEDVSVCTEAVKLNLVSSNGVRPILLTAPSGARMVLVEESAAESGGIRLSASGMQGD